MVEPLSWSQPALFDTPLGVRWRFDVLLDHDDQTAVIVIEARSFPSQQLLAMESTFPVPLPRAHEAFRTMLESFREHVWQATGPFADPFTTVPD